MKIGIVTTWFERGAAYVSRQYRDVLRKEHEVFIYARGGEEYAKDNSSWDDGSITWNKQSSVLRLQTIHEATFKKWIIENNLEVVIFNEETRWYPILICNQLGVKTGAYIDYYTEETIPLFKNYDFLICNTRRHYSAFSWHPQCFFVPWGTDINLFKPKGMDNVDPQTLMFFHSAGFNPGRKGTDFVLMAFSQLSGNAKLIIHSQVELTHYFPKLKDMIEKLKNEGKLIYIKDTVPAPGLYHMGDIYVYPTRLEGIGLTIMEALSCGLPVITTDCAPMNEFINDENGKLIKVEKSYCRADAYYWPLSDVSVDSLSKCMQEYVDNFHRIKEFKAKTREHAIQDVDWEKNSIVLLDYIKDIKKIPADEKIDIERKALEYDKKRMSSALQIYRKHPILFSFCRYSWLLVKKILSIGS